MTDCDLILRYFKCNVPGWHNAANMMRTMKPGAVGWAMRSRISDLNKKLPATGRFIESRIGKNGMAEYKLTRPESFAFDAAGQGVMFENREVA